MGVPQVVAGMIECKVNGKQVLAHGSWSYMINPVKREMLVGLDGVHGFKETPMEAYIEGEVRDMRGLNLMEDLYNVGKESDEDTVTLHLRNGKHIVLHGAVFTGDGAVGVEEGTIPVRFSGKLGEEQVR